MTRWKIIHPVEHNPIVLISGLVRRNFQMGRDILRFAFTTWDSRWDVLLLNHLTRWKYTVPTPVAISRDGVFRTCRRTGLLFEASDLSTKEKILFVVVSKSATLIEECFKKQSVARSAGKAHLGQGRVIYIYFFYNFNFNQTRLWVIYKS